MKQHLIFDVTDVDTIADSDSVGAFVRAGNDGALIGSKVYDSENWLNTASILHDENGDVINDANPLAVNLVTPITVDVDLKGVYDVGTNPTPDNVGMILHTRNATPGNAQQVERTTAGLIATIASASLATVHAIDTNSFMYALDDVSGDAETLTKDGTSGGLNVHLAGSDITLSVNDAALANSAITTEAVELAVANTAESVTASPLALRKYLFIHNVDNKKVFIGPPGVTAANGFPLFGGNTIDLRAGAAVDVNYVTDTVGHEIRTMQLS